MRALARGPSGTLMQSMPAALQSLAPSISRAASTPRGGRISTKATKCPAASFAPSELFWAAGTFFHGLRTRRGRLDHHAMRRFDVLQAARFGSHRLDMFRSGAAAAADDPHAGEQKPAGV